MFIFFYSGIASKKYCQYFNKRFHSFMGASSLQGSNVDLVIPEKVHYSFELKQCLRQLELHAQTHLDICDNFSPL